LNGGDRDPAAEKLEGPGVAEDMGVGELLGDSGLLGPLIEHAPEGHGDHLKDFPPSLREVSPVGGNFARDIQTVIDFVLFTQLVPKKTKKARNILHSYEQRTFRAFFVFCSVSHC